MKTYEQLYDENGNYRLDESYTEILKLHKLLIDANIPHTFDRFLDGWQIVYPNNENRVADAIQHHVSYGNEKNLLEIMGLLTPMEEESDSVLGCLTAEDVFNRMREHYTAHNHVRKTNYDNVIVALDKQIPKKPIIHGVRDRDINTISYTCPICNKHIGIREDYCKHCGQALDWSEEE